MLRNFFKVPLARRLCSVAMVLAVTLATAAHSAITTLSVTIDTDNNATTGCTITTAGGTLSGVEVVLDTLVTTTGASSGSVGSVTRRNCSAGAFGVPAVVSTGGWAVGMGSGSEGSDVIETFVPLADLGATGPAVRVAAISAGDVIAGGLVRLADELTAATVIPTNTSFGLAALIVFVLALGLWRYRVALRSGSAHFGWVLLIGAVMMGGATAWVYAITRDGLINDWNGITVLATDPRGDAAAGQDLVTLYAVKDFPNLSIRIDAVLARDLVAPTNTPPAISGLNNQSLTLPTVTLSLAPTVTDDGLPAVPGTLSYLWTQLAGPSVVFSAANSKNTIVTFGAMASVYTLRLTVSDSALSTSRDITVNVNAAGTANQAPLVTAGANQAIALPNSAALAGSVSDDGLPSPPQLTTTWSFVSGPLSGVTFADPSAPATAASFSAPGVYVLRLTANDGVFSATSDTQVTVVDGPPLMLAIPDRTISLGTRYQQLLVGRDGNVNDTLTYALITAPAGANLSPAPLVDWLPTAAQLGRHVFTAKVTDSTGASATTAFNVTVTHTNRTPQLAAQINAILPIGTAFNRALQASDPDEGDTQTFALVTAPAGMTISGNSLSWSTTSRATGDYGVTVRVTDAAGLTASQSFAISLVPSVAAPIAKDDVYTVRVGTTLGVPATGVLGNDTSPSGQSLSATKLTDPDKGLLAVFNANGSFSYTAPATLPPRALNPVVKFRGNNYGSTVFQYAADLDRDGKADYVSNDFGNIRAWRGTDGSQIWQFDSSIATNVDLTGCQFFAFWGEHALGDVSGNGEIDLIMPISCTKDISTNADRLVAINTTDISPTGKVAARWMSLQLSQPHPSAYTTPAGSPLPNPPIHPLINGSAYRTLPTLAKITPTGGTKVLLRKLWASTEGSYFATSALGSYTNAGCRTATGLASDEGRACKATYVLNATTGAVEHVLTAPNNADEQQIDNGPTTNSPPIVADLDGDGQVEIISGSDVWKLVSSTWTLLWQATFESNAGFPKAFEPDSVAVADLDGDGKAEIIMHVLPTGNTGVQYYGWIYIFSHDGVLKRKIPLEHTLPGLVSVGDVDGDGVPEIMLTVTGVLYVYRGDGSLLWAKELTDDVTGVTPVINQLQPGLRSNNSPVYVYDLDLDGVPEVILQGSRRLFIFDGRTGAELWSIDLESEGYNNSDTPMLVDADGDGRIDIVVNTGSRWNCTLGGGPVACKGGTFTISGGDLNWAPGPKVQNQLNFRASAINDSAVIGYDASVRRDFRQQIQRGTVIDPRISQSTSFAYKANDGAADSAPATVQIDIKPLNRPPVITSITPTAFSEAGLPSEFRTVYTITAVDPDPGDSVRYEFVAVQGRYVYPPTVDSATGALSVWLCGAPCGARPITIVVAAVDSFGARTEQSMIINFTPTIVVVPNVVGQPRAAAFVQLEAGGLTPAVLSEVFSAQPSGTVIAQDPIAGAANIPVLGTVRLTVSKGYAPVLVPYVVGDSVALASSKLAVLGFSRSVTPVFSSEIPANQVISQAPAAGTALSPVPTNPVALSVSAGPPLTMPIASIVVEPGPGPVHRLASEEQQYKAIALFSDGTSADISLSAAWVSSATGIATINTVGLSKAISSGTITISATLGGKTGSSSLSVIARALGDNTPPTATITAPVDGGAIAAPTAIIGTASDANFLRYELAIARAGEESYTVLSESNVSVSNGALANLDPATLVNDLYTLRLTVYDRAENVSVTTRTIQVKGDRKVGLFNLTYQDLNVPAAGIPLTVHRTYDSRDKSRGDFGVGWRLGLQTLRLRTNRVLGTGWVRNVTGISVTLAPTSEHKVSIALPDGRVEEFDMIVSPTSNVGSLNATTVTNYQARTGTLGTLQALANNSVLILNGASEVELVDDTTLNAYSPALYRYTMVDGTQIEISPGSGVKKVTDKNGNAITFGPSGILHSDGRGITFNRDLQDRITSITDLLGNVQTYSYDSNGDLVAHTNAMGAISTFRYDRNHGLIDIIDATGNRPSRNEYDATGRLISNIDANGNRVSFAHNDAALEEIITDRLGGVNRLLYDANGNVLSSQQNVTVDGVVVAATTTVTYDAENNETSRIDADGRKSAAAFTGRLPLNNVIDPAGLQLTTSYIHNAQSEPTQVTDPGARNYTFAYNGTGNLTGLGTPMAGLMTTTVNARGQGVQGTDALGTTTSASYDAAGNVIREEISSVGAVLLRRTDWTYDANGNKLSETIYRTIGGSLTPLTTRFSYDAANRLVSMTNPLGGITRSEYDAAGRVIAQVDPLGRRTTFGRDSFGRVVQTTYPDGVSETVAFDVSGNIAAQTNALGHATTHQYDELNRAVKVTLPDGTFMRTVYSAGGRVMATINANGQRTDFTYDAAGRRTKTTLPAVGDGVTGATARPTVQHTLNALGAPTTNVDPLARSTNFTYDANGRLTRVTFADGQFAQTAYDALGRKASVTNEEGQITTYTYDGLGRLLSVSGILGDAVYTYDEAGNLRTQTDALGRVTEFQYDALNRPTERKYPGAESERYTYDAVGNRVTMTDAAGRTTTFAYDARNRLIASYFPGGETVSRTYAADGQLLTVTDVRGTTAYSYDSRGRLVSVAHPTGDTLRYTYDGNGNVLTIVAPASTQSYVYDALDRVVQTTAPEGVNQSFYDLAGNRVRNNSGNGTRTDITYDARNRPTLVAHKSATDAVLHSFATTYSNAGRRMQVTESNGAVQTYSYDAKGRLISESRSGSNAFSDTHTYDSVGNRTQRARGGVATAFSYDSNDRLLSNGSATYTYDANGNLRTRTVGAVQREFGFDAQKRLVTVVGDGLANQYRYDAFGSRVFASNAAGSTRYLVDSLNNTGLSQVLEERDGSGALNARYAYSDNLLAMTQRGNTNYLHADTQGNTRLLTNNAGAISDTYIYDGYGNDAGATGSSSNPYRYRGQRLDADTGLYQLRARSYDSAAGRFISRDPFGGRPTTPVSQHRYLYANSDPVNNSDPTGLETLLGLTVANYLDNTLEAAFSTGPYIHAFCDLKTRLDVAGNAVFWGGLAVGAFSAFANYEGYQFVKSGISIAAINPTAFRSEAIQEAEIRIDIPWTFTIALRLVNQQSRKFSLGPKGFIAAASAPIYRDNIFKCGLPVGSVELKVGAKFGGRPIDLKPETNYLSGYGTFSAELVAFSTLRLEFPILEIGFGLFGGYGKGVDNLFGRSLLP